MTKNNVKLVGVLNITPDSFSDGGKYEEKAVALAHADELMKNGAKIIDIGAESTRPGAKPLTTDEEWARLEAIVPELVEKYPKKVSLDTRNTEIARRFLELGGKIINSVNGAKDRALWELVKEYNAEIWVNHFPGKSIAEVHKLEIKDMEVVVRDLEEIGNAMQAFGIRKEQIVLDPGIGFGKTMKLNEKLLQFAKETDYKVLIGFSKKRFLGENRKEKAPNVAAFGIVEESGAEMCRVHNPEWFAK